MRIAAFSRGRVAPLAARDGYADFLVGAHEAQRTNGAVYLVLGGGSPASTSLATAIEYTGEASFDEAGISVSDAGDVDGDGYADFLVGAHLSDGGATDGGAAYLVLGSASPASASLSTAIEYTGEESLDYAGHSVSGAGDVDGDGYPDFLVGAFVNDASADQAGAAYLLLGGGSPASASLSAAIKYTGEALGDYAGYSVSGAGDVDSDGYTDLLVGAFNNDYVGAAYLVRGGGL